MGAQWICGANPMEEINIVDIWFRLRDQMMKNQQWGEASSLRPPSLRDACYAYVLSIRSDAPTDPEMIESYVNGLELGAISALREAWKKKND
jgi:hypothetical protein